MAHIAKSVVIDAPLSDVYRYATNLGKVSEWFPLEVRNPSQEVAAVGAKYDWSYSMVGIKFDGTTEYLEVVSNELVRLKTTGGIPSKWDYRFSSDGARTRLEVTVDYDVPGRVLGKIADKLVVERVNGNTVESALANLKAICEAQKNAPKSP
jgi:uncharacterized membrane protein